MSSVPLVALGSHASSRLGIKWVLFAASPVLFALLALALGKKTGWDLHNYHWYNPYALLTGRFGFDVAVGHNATYYNPLSDIPLYLLGLHFPAWTVGVFLGAMAGVAVALIGVVAYLSLPISDRRARLASSAILALCGAFGAGAFQEIGDPANDIPAAIGIFAALALLLTDVRCANSLMTRSLAIAGLCTGAAVALKLTIAVFAVGIAIAIFAVAGNFRARLGRTMIFGLATLAGLAVIGGHWMLTMWDYSGNPFFPYFNDFFRSPLLLDTGYMDRNFKPSRPMEWLLFPFYFTFDSHFVSESSFRDAHILALYLLIPIGVLFSIVRKVRLPSRSSEMSPQTRFLFYFAGAAYLAWLLLFDIYRYLIPLEMLAPLLIALAIQLWPAELQLRIGAVALILAGLQLLVRIDLSDRQSWEGPYVAVRAPEPGVEPTSMILMTGHEPMSYAIPSFPRSVPFLRIDGWLVQGSDTKTGLAVAMRRRVAEHRGPLYVLFSPKELEATNTALAHYGLRSVELKTCGAVTSNISISLALCSVSR